MTPPSGQQVTCDGPRHKTFTLEAIETQVDLGMGTTFEAWTYDGHVPGPILEACQGDLITIHVVNKGTTSHGLDTHAFLIDSHRYGPTPPGSTLTIEKTVETPGVFMYHCASGPVTDLHIKSGLHGAMIVYPRDEKLRPAREIVVVEDAVYGDRDADGHIPGTDPERTLKNDPEFVMFNGKLEHKPVSVSAGDLIRVAFVNVGPGVSSVHVIGGLLDRVYEGEKTIEHIQTYGLPAGSGMMFEFRIPEEGLFNLVDHDKLGYVPTGLVVSFAADS